MTIQHDAAVVLAGPVLKAGDVAMLRRAAQLRTEAAQVLDQARADADGIREEARRVGRQEALSEAAVTCAQMVAATQARLQSHTDGLAEALAEAAARAVAQIVGDPAAPAVVEATVGAALDRAKRHRQVRIFVWPDAVDAARQGAERALAHREDGVELLGVDADPRLAPGRIVLSSERGYVELGVDDQITVAKAGLKRALHSSLDAADGGVGDGNGAGVADAPSAEATKPAHPDHAEAVQ